MLKRFVEGLGFGAGFGIAFVAIWFVAAYFFTPIIYDFNDGQPGPTSSDQKTPGDSTTSFHDLSLDRQIEMASVIALAQFVPAEDGRMKAVLTEFLKMDPKTTISYEVGDEHPRSGYYPRDGVSHGDGLVMFFTGSPATVKMSLTYADGRIPGLGDMPLDVLRKKCAGEDA